jgi:TPR repeat protein
MNDKLMTRTARDDLSAEIATLETLVSRAEKGDPNDQYLVAVAYDEECPISLRNTKEAVKWYTLAARQGHAKAQTTLGMMYERESGEIENNKKAMEWYLLAANQGDAEARFRIGMMYLLGQGVEQNCGEALEWLGFAAKQGHHEAQFTLRSEFGFLVSALPGENEEEVK